MFTICNQANTPAAVFINNAREYRDGAQLSVISAEIAEERNATKFVHYGQHLNPRLSVHAVYTTSTYIPDYTRVSFSRLRLMSHSLRVETGRWSRTPREERLCDRCDTQQVQDEEHVLISCPSTQHIRQRFDALNFASLRTLMDEEEQLKELLEYVNTVLDSFK